jgi:multimeric flavodoxin WrbA
MEKLIFVFSPGRELSYNGAVKKNKKKCLVICASPRRGGVTDRCAATALRVIEKAGFSCKKIIVRDMDIRPCRGSACCSGRKNCVSDDDMTRIYPELEKASLLIVSTPVYFYSVPSQMKAFIDRCQVFWERKYYKDPSVVEKHGFLIAHGEMKGKDIFCCVEKTVDIFFQTIKARRQGQFYFKSLADRNCLMALEKEIKRFLFHAGGKNKEQK